MHSLQSTQYQVLIEVLTLLPSRAMNTCVQQTETLVCFYAYSPLKLEHLDSAYLDHWDTELKQTVRFWLKHLKSGMRPVLI